MERPTKSPSKRLRLIALTLGVGLTLGAGDLQAQEHNLKTAVESAQTPQSPQDQKIQQLEDKLEQIQKELMELKQANAAPPETHYVATTKASAPPPAISEQETVITDPSNPKSEPFAFADFTWLTGNARTVDTPYATKFFTPEIRPTSTTPTTSATPRTTPSAARAKSSAPTKSR